MAQHPDDGKFVVVQDGQRVSGELHENAAAAQKEADATKKERPVTENAAPAPKPEVKQNLYG